MGLLDILNGMQNGPRGPSDPNAKSEGMSPITMAILALLAYKAVKHIGGSQPGASPAAPPPAPVNAGLPGGLGGGLGGGGLSGGGLGDLLKQFQQNGQGDTADSWVSPGPNKQISPGDLGKALGVDQINTLTSQTGLSREELLSGLSQYLPEAVNHLTPDGRVPTEGEMARHL
jgi:uncharacterized protein YidB (DUF937 family)